MSAISKQALLVDNNQSFPNNNAGEITPSDLRAFNVNVIDSTVNQTQYNTNSGSWNVSIGQLNAFTASQQPTFNALNSFTASQLTINSGVNSFTQSATGRLNALEVNTTNLNSFTSSINQILVNGVSIGTSTRLFFNGFVSASIVPNVNGAIASITVLSDPSLVTTSSFNSYTASTNASINALNAFSTSLDTNFVSEVEFTNYSSSVSTTINALSNSTGAFATTGSNTFVGDQIISGSTDLGFVTIRDNGGINFACTGSGPVTSYGMVTNPSNGDLVFNTNPGNGRLMTFGQTDARAQIWGGLYLNRIDGGGGVVMTTHSGSLFLTPSGQSSTTESVLHVTSSSPVNNVNLIFKPNNSNGDTFVSGSSNIFSNQAAATAGFKRYIGGSQNYFGAALPQITGSAAFTPIMNSNIVNSTMLMRIPVSSSAYNINGNIISNASTTAIQFGTAAATHFERAVSGVNILNNVLFGQVNAVASKTTLSSSFNLNSNNIGGTVNLNMDSSSIGLVTSNVQGQLTVNNSYFPSTLNQSSGLVTIQSLNNVGANFIFLSGSNTTFPGPTRSVTASSLLGGFNMLSASLNGDNAQINSTHLIGQGLVAVGTNSRPLALSAADWGSVFVGRWNDLSGSKDTTAETVFAVGTGTSNTTRRTGLLIDSGSNTFIEGTLTITGSVYGNVSASTITSSTASIDLSVANYFTLTLAGTTRINVINPQPGVTATLVINTDTAASASFSSNVKQPSGSFYAASPSGNIDIISFTAVNSTTVYAFPAQSFV